jgi:hypothetical protein
MAGLLTPDKVVHLLDLSLLQLYIITFILECKCGCCFFLLFHKNMQGDVIICGRKRHGLVSDEDISGLRIGLVCFRCSLLYLKKEWYSFISAHDCTF